jgi:hypothetical protein
MPISDAKAEKLVPNMRVGAEISFFFQNSKLEKVATTVI